MSYSEPSSCFLCPGRIGGWYVHVVARDWGFPIETITGGKSTVPCNDVHDIDYCITEEEHGQGTKYTPPSVGKKEKNQIASKTKPKSKN